MSDARFEEGAGEAPLALIARTPGDLAVISALVQDAVLRGADLRYDAAKRHFALMLGRFRWEDAGRAEKAARPYERVRAVLSLQDVLAVQAKGLPPEAEAPLQLLGLHFTPEAAPGGVMELRFAGGAALRLQLEALEVTLKDISRPYRAPSGKKPAHPDADNMGKGGL